MNDILSTAVSLQAQEKPVHSLLHVASGKARAKAGLGKEACSLCQIHVLFTGFALRQCRLLQ